jgi:hypothetical protein
MSRRIELPEAFVFVDGTMAANPSELATIVAAQPHRVSEVWGRFCDGDLEQWLVRGGWTTLAQWLRQFREQGGGRDPNNFSQLFCGEIRAHMLRTTVVGTSGTTDFGSWNSLQAPRAGAEANQTGGAPAEPIASNGETELGESSPPVVARSKQPSLAQTDLLRRQQGALSRFLNTQIERQSAATSLQSEFQVRTAQVEEQANLQRGEVQIETESGERLYREAQSRRAADRDAEGKRVAALEAGFRSRAQQATAGADDIRNTVSKERTAAQEAPREVGLGHLGAAPSADRPQIPSLLTLHSAAKTLGTRRVDLVNAIYYYQRGLRSRRNIGTAGIVASIVAALGLILFLVEHHRVSYRNCCVYRTAFSPDGRILAGLHGDGSVSLWSFASGSESARLGPPSGIRLSSSIARGALSFSRDGTKIAASAGNPSVQVYDLHIGREIANIPGSTQVLQDAAFTADGAYLVTAGSELGSLREIEVEAQRTVKNFSNSLGERSPVNQVEFAPSGASFAARTGDGDLFLLNSAGQLVGRPSGASNLSCMSGTLQVRSGMAFADDVSLLFSGFCAVYLWKVDSGVVRALAPMAGAARIAVSARSKLFAVSRYAEAGVSIHNLDRGNLTVSLPIGSTSYSGSTIKDLAFDPSGHFLACAMDSDSVLVFDARTGHEVRRFLGPFVGIRAEGAQ